MRKSGETASDPAVLVNIKVPVWLKMRLDVMARASGTQPSLLAATLLAEIVSRDYGKPTVCPDVRFGTQDIERYLQADDGSGLSKVKVRQRIIDEVTAVFDGLTAKRPADPFMRAFGDNVVKGDVPDVIDEVDGLVITSTDRDRFLEIRERWADSDTCPLCGADEDIAGQPAVSEVTVEDDDRLAMHEGLTTTYFCSECHGSPEREMMS